MSVITRKKHIRWTYIDKKSNNDNYVIRLKINILQGLK